MTALEKESVTASETRRPLWWCFPSLFGFLGFLFSFPIDRSLPFWPNRNLGEIFTLWFLFITPVATLIAIVTLIRNKKGLRRSVRWFYWTMIALSVIVNAFVLVGMWASTY
jgi:hypothetical protein